MPAVWDVTEMNPVVGEIKVAAIIKWRKSHKSFIFDHDPLKRDYDEACCF